MFIRDYNGNIVKIDISKFNTTYEFYQYLWKIKYNKNITYTNSNIKDIFDYVNGEKKFI
mgnify:FL=1|tara:strand:- start:2735 stop:2911 length:177 start_codon:yes stop_codon:yes gene_type:complete